MKTTLLTTIICLSINMIVNSQTTFSTKKPINTSAGDAPFVIDAGNLDDDAFPDIVIGTSLGNTVEWYKNNGDGTFTMQTLIANDCLQCGGVTIADLNDDGFNDVIASNFIGDKLVWYENDGLGNFATEQIISNSVNGSSGIVTGFIDGNLTVDVAVVGYNSGETYWFSNDGMGNFSSNLIESIPGSGPGNVDLADFDGDGDNDIVLLNSDIGTVELYYNNLIPSGTTTFTKDLNSVTTGEGFPFDARFGDVDDDTNLDIIVVDLFGGATGLGWYKKEMDGTYTETIIPTAINYPATAMVEDMDNDTYNDIVLSSGGNGAGTDITWYRSTDSGTFGSEIVIDDTQSQTYAFTLEDFDNDGDIDIANIAYNDDDLNWFENKLITLSLNNQIEKTISIYPNPTSSILNFKGLISENIEVTVYDILGKKILTNKLDMSSTLNVSTLENGTYILKIKNHDNILKFVKK